jgi:hypothetical protein
MAVTLFHISQREVASLSKATRIASLDGIGRPSLLKSRLRNNADGTHDLRTLNEDPT